MLENIFVFQIYLSKFRKLIQSSKLYKPAVNQVLDLQKNGTIIEIKKNRLTVYFEIFNLGGDNLETHSLLSFTESFSSNNYCRKCYLKKEKCESATELDVCELRNLESHKLDVANKSNGVTTSTVFSSIPNFNIFNHASYDPMHDLYEGICRYEIAEILNHLIFEYKFFDLKLLNDRIASFS